MAAGDLDTARPSPGEASRTGVVECGPGDDVAAAADEHCLVSALLGVGHKDSSLPENLEREGADPPTMSRCRAFR